MLNTDQQAHDLALAFLNYKLSIEVRGTDAEHDEEIFFEMYKESFDNFLDMLNNGI